MKISFKGQDFWCKIGRGRLGQGVKQNCLQVTWTRFWNQRSVVSIENWHKGYQAGKLMTGVLLKEEDSVWRWCMALWLPGLNQQHKRTGKGSLTIFSQEFYLILLQVTLPSSMGWGNDLPHKRVESQQSVSSQGTNHSCSTACATVAHSVGEGLWLLQNGAAEVKSKYPLCNSSSTTYSWLNMSNCLIVQEMACGGVDAWISPLGMLGFSSARAPSKRFNETPEVTIGIKRSSSYMQIRWPADPLMPSEMVLWWGKEQGS